MSRIENLPRPGSGAQMRNQAKMGFVRWIVIFTAVYSALEAVFVGIAGIAFRLPFRHLLVPYGILLLTPFVMAPLVFWARQRYDHPKSFAFRFAIAIFLGTLIFTSALAFDIDRTGLLSRPYLMENYVPYIVPGSLIAAIMIYRAMRNRKRS